jgi:catechol 2,3-dioxygenase-like lactoylglutathione lyase family enzyme
MLDHVIVTVSNFTRSIAFYEQALKPLGIADFHDFKGQDGHPDLKGFGNDGRFFSGSRREGPIRAPFTSVLSPKVTPR